MDDQKLNQYIGEIINPMNDWLLLVSPGGTILNSCNEGNFLLGLGFSC